MPSYILKRFLSLIPTLFVVSLVVFLVVYLIPGGPATAILGIEATAEELDALNAQLGFDRPFLEQYAGWLGGVFQGDWGQSYFLNMTVLEAIGEYFQPTLSLALYAELVCLILAVPMGILAAYKRGTLVDTAAVSVSLVGIALPGFLLSMLLMLFFGVKLKWLPVAGYRALSDGLGQHIKYLTLPALSLGLVQAAYITRMTRSSMLDVLYMNYIRTVRAKGQREAVVVLVYGLKNAAPTILTVIGQSFGSLVTGTIVTESIFNIPGLGKYFVTSIKDLDYTMIGGTTVFYGALLIACTLVVDLLYGLIDPRVKLEE